MTGLISNTNIAGLLLGLWLATCAAWSDAAELVLRERFIPTGPVIHLGDIADIRAVNGEEARRLATLPLWTSPAAGDQRFVTPHSIRNVLNISGVDASKLQFSGASRVAIGTAAPAASGTASNDPPATPPASREVASTGFRPGRTSRSTAEEATAPRPLLGTEREALLESVREESLVYLEQMRGYAGQLEVAVRLTHPQIEQLARRTGDFTLSGGRAPWTGRQLLALEFETPQGRQKLSFTADVLDTTPLVVVKRPLARGQTITAADVALESPTRETRLPVSKVALQEMEDALGKEAQRALRPGEVLTSDLCLAPLAIQRNQIVTVTVAGGGIELSRQAKALTDARLGDFTEVQLLNSKERLAARVVGPGKLAIADTASTLPPATTAQREKRYLPR